MKAQADVTVVIPTIAVRRDMLTMAQASVALQTLPVAATVVEVDEPRTGSAATRNRALAKVDNEWVLWLDDDDVLMPHAVQLLVEAQRLTGADVVSGGAWIPQVSGHGEPTEPLPGGWVSATAVRRRSRLTVTSLMRTELVLRVGGFEFRRDPGTGMELDDYGLYYKLADAGATFWRIPERVFVWNVHGQNTSGQPDR